MALGARLPTLSGIREHVEAGGLMSYGPNFPDLFRRAADYADKILRGAKPGTLPVEQPTKFDLVINLTYCQGAWAENLRSVSASCRSGDRIKRCQPCHLADITLSSENVRYWHEADIPSHPPDVRCWGKSGHRQSRPPSRLLTLAV